MWRWIKDHVWLVLFTVVAVAGFLFALFRWKDKDGQTLDDLKNKLALEKRIIDEKAKVRKMAAKEDHKRVAAKIQEEYKADIEKLEEDQKKQVEELADDPEALIAHLLRITA